MTDGRPFTIEERLAACGLTTYYEELQVPGNSWRVVVWKEGYLDYGSFYRKN